MLSIEMNWFCVRPFFRPSQPCFMHCLTQKGPYCPKKGSHHFFGPKICTKAVSSVIGRSWEDYFATIQAKSLSLFPYKHIKFHNEIIWFQLSMSIWYILFSKMLIKGWSLIIIYIIGFIFGWPERTFFHRIHGWVWLALEWMCKLWWID